MSSVADELPRGFRDVPEREARPNVVSRSAETAARRRAEQGEDAPSFEAWAATMRPRFVDVPDRCVPPNCAPADVTRHMLDKVINSGLCSFELIVVIFLDLLFCFFFFFCLFLV